MEALQYIYTSWKNGNSTEKGYMIYSRSEGISEAECVAIKDAMQYLAPKELTLNPSQQEIADVFPYAFSYFLLPTGRGCVAQSTYLGKDYSGRYGNYIIYALVFDVNDLPCRPSELFAESYMKTAMTEEELNAPSPVPPLPPLPITEYASVVNDDQLNEFIFDKEEEFAQLIAMVLAARDAGVPFYLNDTRENLVLWSAAVQRILPPGLARNFTFNTYIGDHEMMRSPRIREEGLNFHIIGVRPDANYFNYATESRSNRHMVMDFLGGNMTEGIAPSSFAQAMASSLTMDYEEVDAFGEFVDGTAFSEISGHLEDAFLYYQLLRHDEFDFSEENVAAVISFGEKYCDGSDNTDVASKLLVTLQENERTLRPDTLAELWKFVCKHAGFMMFTLFDLLQETLYQISGDATEPCGQLTQLIKTISSETPSQYKEFLAYVNSADCIDQLLLYLSGHRNIHTNNFYIRWILQEFPMPDGLNGRQPVAKLLKTLLNNICRIDDSEKSMVEFLFATASNQVMFTSVLQTFMGAVQEPVRLERLCSRYVEAAESLSDRQVNHFEQMMLSTPGAAPIATRLCARKISASKKPDEEFWRFYEHQRHHFSTDTSMTIDPMVLACMSSIDRSRIEAVAVDMLSRLDLSLLQDPAAIRRLTDVINNASVKALIKMDRAVLQKAGQLRSKADHDGLDKVRAVYVGEILEANLKQKKRPVSLSEEILQMGVSLANLDRGDYDTYLKEYFDAYIVLLCCAEDISALMQIFYSRRFFQDFTGDYISAIKKMEKKEPEKWARVVAWTCVYLSTAPKSAEPAEELYKPMVRYLRSLDEGDLVDIRQNVIKDVPSTRCDPLFDEVRRKEGLSEKLGGLFRRK